MIIKGFSIPSELRNPKKQAGSRGINVASTLYVKKSLNRRESRSIFKRMSILSFFPPSLTLASVDTVALYLLSVFTTYKRHCRLKSETHILLSINCMRINLYI